MTLHKAMQTVLSGMSQQTGTTEAVCAEIIQRGLYKQKKGSDPHADQIRIRAINYPELFDMVDRDTVHLKATAPATPPDPNQRPSYRGEDAGPCPECGADTVARKSRTTAELYFGCTAPKRGPTGDCNFHGCRSH